MIKEPGLLAGLLRSLADNVESGVYACVDGAFHCLIEDTDKSECGYAIKRLSGFKVLHLIFEDKKRKEG